MRFFSFDPPDAGYSYYRPNFVSMRVKCSCRHLHRPRLQSGKKEQTMHAVVSHEDWIKARTELLKKEKELTHLREELAEQRRALPWEKVEKEYVFDAPGGKETLSGL